MFSSFHQIVAPISNESKRIAPDLLVFYCYSPLSFLLLFHILLRLPGCLFVYACVCACLKHIIPWICHVQQNKIIISYTVAPVCVCMYRVVYVCVCTHTNTFTCANRNRLAYRNWCICMVNTVVVFDTKTPQEMYVGRVYYSYAWLQF